MAWRSNVLVIASVTATSADLLAALEQRVERGPIAVTLLMPAAEIGLAGRDAAKPHLEAALAGWREASLQADGIVGDTDPMGALHDAWDPGRFDEVFVSTLPGETSRWIRSDLPHRVAAFTGVPVTHVVAMDMRPAPRTGPAPTSQKAPLGPLSVMTWGGGRRSDSGPAA
jgi:hypothetical protein